MWHTRLMKLAAAATLALATVAIGLAADEPKPMPVQPVNAADRTEMVKGGNAFALDLFATLRDDENHKGNNVFFSPLSIWTALAMTYGGARGSTAEEMAKAMHISLSQEKLHPAVGGLIGELNGSGKRRNCQLSIANALWGQVGHPFSRGFLILNQAHYRAGLELVDFKGAPQQARRTINDWCETKTAGKIKNLLSDDSVGEMTRLVLTNAIYLKGEWQGKFDKELTKDGDFQVKPGATVKVPMMHRKAPYRYFEAESFKALELPYKDYELSMFVFLPKKADGLADLEKSFTRAQLETWLAKPWPFSPLPTDLTLPRFTLTDASALKPALVSLGMTKLFSREANLTGISNADDLVLQDAIHKAFVDVNEEGTEAAASTAVVLKVKADFSFTADRPFLFLIRDNASGSILFLGRVVDPSVK